MARRMNVNSLVDFHSHILPSIDDGSKSVDESVMLLARLREQGVATVVATPHFYADDQSVDAFLIGRKRAYEAVCARLSGESPRVLLGAEVCYYSGISRLEGLDRLCIEGTRVLLLEMPMSRWTSSVIREVLDIANNKNLTLVLAHIERYRKLQNAEALDELRRQGVLMQTNASYVLGRFTRRSALRLLRRWQVQLLGSDCHGLHNRPPMIGEAAHVIRKKCGDDLLGQLNEFAESLLPQ